MSPTPLCGNTPLCESIFEEPSAGIPHAGFRGGRVARGGQPFYPDRQEIGHGGVLRHRQPKGAANGATVHLNYGACRLLDFLASPWANERGPCWVCRGLRAPRFGVAVASKRKTGIRVRRHRTMRRLKLRSFDSAGKIRMSALESRISVIPLRPLALSQSTGGWPRAQSTLDSADVP